MNGWANHNTYTKTRQKVTINCKGQLIDLSQPKVMGILNLTPDSFYDGGKYKDKQQILQQVESMLLDGATFIDLGAYSSRPGADHISVSEELKRMIPVVTMILKEFPHSLLSIDTFRSSVAKECVQIGAALINDISAGLLDPEMLRTVAACNVPYCMMHLRGTPQTMKMHTSYNNLLKELIFYFSDRIRQSRKLGIKDIIIDPGFGFAKNTTQNFMLLKNLSALDILGLPILVGVSRKSMIYKTLETTAANALNGTTVLNTIALQNGAKILRVHDVKEAVETICLWKAVDDY